MVALLSGRLRSFSVTLLQPCEHGLADVDSPVVHLHLQHFVPVGLKKLRHRPAEQVIPYMSQMQRLVCVRRREFHHDGLACRLMPAEILRRCNPGKYPVPVHCGKGYVQKSLHHIIGGDFRAV